MSVARLGLLAPLRGRDFALLTAGTLVSQLGDGLFLVALAWQVYQIRNVPSALAIVGIAWTLPLCIFALLGGVVSDRVDRRHAMIGADLLRALAVGAAGLLAVIGRLQLWHLVVVASLIGIGDAFFSPASISIMPQLVAREELGTANALRGFLRPFALNLVGPALGGLLTGAAGPGVAFLVDAASFLASACAVLAIASRPAHGEVVRAASGALQSLREGLRFVRTHPWCWTSLVGGSFSLLAYFGPSEVLLPYLAKNELDAGAQGLGAILALRGVGAVVAALAIGQAGVPRRLITAMAMTWAGGLAASAGFGLMTTLWQGLAVALVGGALLSAAEIFWATMLQRLVPGELLGRVASVDVLSSSALLPLSQGLIGPLVQVVGARAVMTAGPLLAGLLFTSFMLVPGVRDPERRT